MSRFGHILVRPRSEQNPFSAGEPPQIYCKECKEETDYQQERGNAGGVYVYRSRCLRCGEVVQYGIDHRYLTGEKAISLEALDWVCEAGEDRR